MTDETTSTAPADSFTPDEDDLSGVKPLGKTGAVLAFVDGKRYLLREPKFGQAKRLRISRQQTDDAIAEASAELAKLHGEVSAMQTDIADVDEADLSPAQKRKRDQLVARVRKVRDELTEFADDRRLAWWREVFTVLSADGVPSDDDWPSWVVDTDLPAKVVAHWRHVPLDLG